MLDTIVLQIPIDYSSIVNHDRFNPTTKGINDDPRKFVRYVNNPIKEDKEKWGYMPRLTMIKRGSRIYLKVEFSAPKLLFGNNLDELEENDFNKVVGELQSKILKMGVRLWRHQIEEAVVIVFHLPLFEHNHDR